MVTGVSASDSEEICRILILNRAHGEPIRINE